MGGGGGASSATVGCTISQVTLNDMAVLPDGLPRARGTLLEEQKAAPCNLWLVVPCSRVARGGATFGTPHLCARCGGHAGSFGRSGYAWREERGLFGHIHKTRRHVILRAELHCKESENKQEQLATPSH